MIRPRVRARYRLKGGIDGFRLVKLLACLVLALFVIGPLTAQATVRSAAARPSLRITPKRLDFGAARVGVATTRSLRVTNSTGAVVLLSVGWSTSTRLDPGFRFPTSKQCLRHEVEQLQPGQSCILTFAFTPVTAGVATAAFVFSTDGWKTRAGTVVLKARTAA
jgi:hypothetical protein